MKFIHRALLLSLLSAFLLHPSSANAQVGEHRNDFSIGVNGGYVLSNVGFVPKVPQDFHGGITGGLSFRYVCEKYFNTICSVYAEVNYAQMGWKESLLDSEDKPVVNSVTGEVERYSRTINYVQVPVFAHLAWGKERKGFQFFFQAGPQFGYYIDESTSMNFDLGQRSPMRVSSVIAQDTMAVEHNFEYGIAVGAGMEYSIPRVGHFLLEGRYYYGLGNIYGDTKRDYFAKSNLGAIVIKMSYLFDLAKTFKNK